MTRPAAVAAVGPLRRLRRRSRVSCLSGHKVADVAARAVLAAVCGALAVGVMGLGRHFLTEPGWAPHTAPGRLFLVAAALLLLGGLAHLMRSAGPVTASSAFWFWLLSAPMRRRVLLRRRYAALLAVAAVPAGAVAGLAAHAGSVPAGPAMVAGALAALALAAGAVCGQAWEVAGQIGAVVGQAMRGAGVLAFGSLATGFGRTGLNALLRVPPAAAVLLLAVLAVVAAACCVLGYLALDQIDVGVLRRGQGLWVASAAAAASMDMFLLTEFLADQRARQAGRVTPVRIGAGFAVALARSEWARLRRRRYLAVRALAAAAAWWGCRPVLPGFVLVAAAVATGYCMVLPVAGTLRQLAGNPALRTQFWPYDRLLAAVSLAQCLIASAAWAAVVAPGLGGGAAVSVLVAAGLTAAVFRTVTRPAVDYSASLVPTPMGDLPLGLWRQLLRGPLLLAVLMVVTATVTG